MEDRLIIMERLREPVMSNGLTFSRDMFCLRYVETGEAEESFKRAFGVKICPSMLLEDLFNEPAIVNRISKLWEERVALIQHSCAVDIERLTKELEAARLLAMSKGNASGAVAAISMKAKLHGLLIDRHQFTVKRPEEMSLEELTFITQGMKDVTPAASAARPSGGSSRPPADEDL